jgi:hypothetical protein
VAEGWAQVLQVDGTAERVHDARLTPEEQLERAARAPANVAWRLLRAHVLPELRRQQPGEGIPRSVERQLVLMERRLARAVDDRVAQDVSRIGQRIERRERGAWDQRVTAELGEPWSTPEAGELVSDWAERQGDRLREIRAGIVPGVRASIAEARRKGWSVAQLEEAWRSEGLPLDGYGTAEGRGQVLAREAAAGLAQESTRAAQAAAGAEWYEWGPTTSQNPDPEHAARRGQRFRWDDPPPDGHPGERHGCHCRAIPVVLPEDTKRLKAELPPEPPKITPTARAIPDPKSWRVAHELEADVRGRMTPEQQAELDRLVERDQPVLRPSGPAVTAKDTSRAARAWKATLTPEQVAAINDWSGAGFTRMRVVDTGLMGRHAYATADDFRPGVYLSTRRQLVEIRNAMRSPDAPRHEGELFRGLRFPPDSPFLRQISTEGKEFKLEGLSSWAHNLKAARNFVDDEPGHVLLRVQSSTRGVPINAAGLSTQGAAEGEVLVDKGSAYRVVSVSRDKRDQHRVIVDLVEV